jgi:hypothetical protein
MSDGAPVLKCLQSNMRCAEQLAAHAPCHPDRVIVFTEISDRRTWTDSALTIAGALYLAHRETAAKKAKKARK